MAAVRHRPVHHLRRRLRARRREQITTVAGLLDGSPDMLDEAAQRLAPFDGRWERVRADLHDRTWRRGTFGGVMTSLAVHRLDGPGKRELHRDLHGMLVPGGVFVMADLVEPAGARASVSQLRFSATDDGVFTGSGPGSRGFTGVDLVWLHAGHAIFTATRP